MDEHALRSVLTASLAHEQTLLGAHSVGGRVIELDGLVAAVVPSAPESTLANAAVVLRGDAIAPDVIAALGDAYGAAGVEKWGIWFDPQDLDVLGTVSAAGLVFDSHPAPMGARLADLDLDGAPPARSVPWREAGRVNDLATGHADGTLERMLGALPDAAGHTYAAFDGGECVSVVAVTDHADDAAVWFVATVPWARNAGLATRLMRRALSDARARGCTTTTLVASQLGAPVYAKLGYRTLGELHRWERRP